MLKPLTVEDLRLVLRRGLSRLSGREPTHSEDQVLQTIAQASDGDARLALNLLEIGWTNCGQENLTKEAMLPVLGEGARRFDKRGDVFFDQISALHKDVRG